MKKDTVAGESQKVVFLKLIGKKALLTRGAEVIMPNLIFAIPPNLGFMQKKPYLPVL